MSRQVSARGPQRAERRAAATERRAAVAGEGAKAGLGQRARAAADSAHGEGLGWRAATVFALALAIRLLHIWQIRRSPYFDVLVGDGRAYDEWAQRIAGGEWIGRNVFYQAPLYPYFLGTLYALFGRSLLIVRLVQALLGALGCVFLARAGDRIFGRAYGLAAGTMLALYAPAIFFDGLIQKTVLDGVLICLALWCVAGLIADRSRVRRWLGLGIVLGALALTRENAMVLIAVAAVWSVWAFDAPAAGSTPRVPASSADRVASAGRLAAFVVGLAILLLPVAVRNYAVGGGFYLTTSQFGANLYLGNNAYTDGTAGSLRSGRGEAGSEQQDAKELAERAEGRPLTPSEVSSYWIGQTLTFIRAQPIAWLKLMARKIVLLWNRTEMLDTESQESYAEWSLPLKVGGYVGHFGVLVPLAIAGVMLTWGRRRELMILYALAGAYAASVVLFFIYARYRYPLVPFLLMFAAVAAVGLIDRVREWLGKPRRGADTKSSPAAAVRRRSSRATLAMQAALVIAIAVVTNRPMLSATRMRAITEHNYGAALQSEGRYEDALAHYRRAVEIEPSYAPAYSNMGAAYLAAGRAAEAKAAYERALALQPDFPDAHYNLANALLREGDAAAAVEHFRRAVEHSPGSADVHHNLGLALMETGQPDEAAVEFQRALSFDPSSVASLTALAEMEASRGQAPEAAAHLRRAIDLRPSDASAHYNLARLLVEVGRPADSLPEFVAALALKPDWVDARNDYGIALASSGHVDEAIAQFEQVLRAAPNYEAAARNLAAARASRRSSAR